MLVTNRLMATVTNQQWPGMLAYQAPGCLREMVPTKPKDSSSSARKTPTHGSSIRSLAMAGGCPVGKVQGRVDGDWLRVDGYIYVLLLASSHYN